MNRNLQTISHIFLLFLLLCLSSCGDKKKEKSYSQTESNSDDQSLGEMVAAISQELDLSDINIADSIEVFDEKMDPTKGQGVSTSDKCCGSSVKNLPRDGLYSSQNLAQQDASVSFVKHQSKQVNREPVYTKKSSNSKKSMDLKVIQKGMYIKLGQDISQVVVQRRFPQKITVGIFSGVASKQIDVYVYAIPKYSGLVRNNNTLIGYVKGVDVLHGQAQFTRYWNTQLVNGRFLRSGQYNIYVEYHCRDRNGVIRKKEGRYWGGDHRNWMVRVR